MSWRRVVAPTTKYKFLDDYSQKFNKYRVPPSNLFRILITFTAVGVLGMQLHSWQYGYATS